MESYRTSGLQGISKESIKKAFQKVKPENLHEEWELKLLTKDIQDDAVLFMKEHFVPYEPLIQLFGVQWDEDTDHYWRVVFDQGMSLVLTSKLSGDIIAVRGIDIVTESEGVNTENISDWRLRNLLDYLNYCDDKANFFEHYGISEAVHFSGLAVSESYRRGGIAKLLLKSAIEFVENLGLEYVYIKGEASSDYSKKIYEKFDFETIYEQIYDEYRINGKQVMNNIGEHKTNKVYGKLITGFT